MDYAHDRSKYGGIAMKWIAPKTKDRKGGGAVELISIQIIKPTLMGSR